MIKQKSLKKSYVIRIIAALLIVFIVMSAFITFDYLVRAKEAGDLKLISLSEEFEAALYEHNLYDANGDVDIDKVQALSNLFAYKMNEDTYFTDCEQVYDFGTVLSKHRNVGEDGDVKEKVVINQTINSICVSCEYECKVISLDSVCTNEQIKKIKRLFQKNTVECDSLEGYLDGDFFYPTVMVLSICNDEDEIEKLTIETTFKDDKKAYATIGIPLNPTLYTDDGDIYGAWEHQKEKVVNLKEICENFSNPIWGKDITSTLEITDIYEITFYTRANYIVLAMHENMKLYIALFITLFVIGLFLVIEFDNIAGSRMKIEQRRRNIMDSLAHEMKTPIAVIRNYSEVLLDRIEEEKERLFLKKIIKETETLNESIISVLDLSKMEAGTYSMELSSVDIKSLCESVIADKSIIFDKKSIAIESEIKADERVVVDERLIKNILGNYLSNAAIHTPINGRVSIKVLYQNDEVYFEVYNQGSNISNKDIGKIWDSFYGRKDINKESSGLGLAIVKNACQLHEGSYGCFNEEDGVTFWAKIKSLEDSIVEIEEKTGNITGIYTKSLSKEVDNIVSISLLGIVLMIASLINNYCFLDELPLLNNVIGYGIKFTGIVQCVFIFKLFKEYDEYNIKFVPFFKKITIASVILITFSILLHESLMESVSGICTDLSIFMYLLVITGNVYILQYNVDDKTEAKRSLLVNCFAISIYAVCRVFNLYQVYYTENDLLLLTMYILLVIEANFIFLIRKVGRNNVKVETNSIRKRELISHIKECFTLRHSLSGIKLFAFGVLIIGIGQLQEYYYCVRWLEYLLNPILPHVCYPNINGIISTCIVLFGAILITIANDNLCTNNILLKSKFLIILNLMISLSMVILEMHKVKRYLDSCIFSEAVMSVHYNGYHYSYSEFPFYISLIQTLIMVYLCLRLLRVIQNLTLLHGKEKWSMWLSRMAIVFLTASVATAFVLITGKMNIYGMEISVNLFIIPYIIVVYTCMKIYMEYKYEKIEKKNASISVQKKVKQLLIVTIIIICAVIGAGIQYNSLEEFYSTETTVYDENSFKSKELENMSLEDRGNYYYGKLLREYKAAELNDFIDYDTSMINGRYRIENNKNYDLSYVFLDLADDGIPELFISEGESDTVYDIYTIDVENNYEIKCLIGYPLGNEESYCLCDNNYIRYIGDADDSIQYFKVKPFSCAIDQVEGMKQVLTSRNEKYYFNGYFNFSNKDFIRTSKATEEEFLKFSEKYPQKTDIEWKQLADYE